MSTFITVGNAKQEFRRLFEICFECYEKLSTPVVTQYGFTESKYTFDFQYQFLDQSDFINNVKKSSTIIGHAGAGTIMTALKYGIKPIVIPRLSKHGEHLDDHQLELAQALHADGKVYLVSNASEMRACLGGHNDYIYSQSLKNTMLSDEIANDIISLGGI